MRVVILGGGGFIGRALCRHLAEEGLDAVVVSRSPERLKLPPGVRAVGYAGWEAEVDGAWAVVNLAGEEIAGRWTADKKRRILESRVQSGRKVAAAVQKAATRPRVVVQGSAVGYYGQGTSAVDEASPAGQGFLADVCRQWEPSSAAVEDLGVRRVVVRSGIVLGLGGGILEKMLPAFRMFMGGYPGTGRQMLSWIHLRDEVRAIRFLLGREDLAGPFNLTAPEAVDMRSFCQSLGRVLGRPSWLPIPAAALRAAMGQMAEEMLLAGQNVRPERLLAAGFRFDYQDVASALANILA